jgi:hypothetical protein
MPALAHAQPAGKRATSAAPGRGFAAAPCAGSA